jgi:DNA-binding NtrC family response regulator/predicted TIM-barrel enzyme
MRGGIMNSLTELVRRHERTRPVIAVVAGSGQIARYSAIGGADVLMALNAGLYRNLGTGSLAAYLPFGNANQQTLALLREHILPRANGIPVVAGVFASDPGLNLDSHLKLLKNLGVAGVVNWPSLGFVDGAFGEALREEGVNTQREMDMLEKARALGLVAFGFVLAPDDAARFAAHSDGMILNLGLTWQVRDLVDRRDQVQQAIVRLNVMLTAIERSGHCPLCLAFGGPITLAEDFQQVVRQSRIDGFAGGSVFERLPVEEIVESTVRSFRSVRMDEASAGDDESSGELIGAGAGLRQLRETIRRIAPYDVNVCIEGESGSGKELAASQIHRLSRRAGQSLVTLNCGAIPEPLIESELFGHEKGAFTGAHRRRPGKFELAQGGTLFLDEVADLSPRAQVALLRAIQQREVTRVGGDHPIYVNVRIIAASHQELAGLVRENRFRADLYYRLNQVTIRVPPLREHLEDVPLLVESVLARLRVQLNRRLDGLSEPFSRRLLEYAWPGNVRELEHVICRAAILEDGPILNGSGIDLKPQAAGQCQLGAGDGRQRNGGQSRRLSALEAIRRCNGNRSRAAAEMGISRKTLYAWLREQV